MVGELSDREPENGDWLSGNLSIASIVSTLADDYSVL